VPFPRGSGGITQATGDVTAGPGSGSQAFTLQETANVIAVVSAVGGSLTVKSGVLAASSVALPKTGDVTLILTTASLAIGTWLVIPTLLLQPGAGGAFTSAALANLYLGGGSATYTQLPNQIVALWSPGASGVGGFQTLSWASFVVVTVAGTVGIEGTYSDVTDGGAIYGNGSSGYVAVKVG
jgi:hypothetical protein